jgi:hypothetical protein
MPPHLPEPARTTKAFVGIRHSFESAPSKLRYRPHGCTVNALPDSFGDLEVGFYDPAVGVPSPASPVMGLNG